MQEAKQAVPLSSAEVARLANVTPETVRQWERTGKLPCTRTASGMRLFAPADVERFLEERGR